MDVQEINVIIDANGQVQVEVHGVKGQSCLDITRALETALGGEILLREMTPEALDQPISQVDIPPHLQTKK
jgi:hypothetical protein